MIDKARALTALLPSVPGHWQLSLVYTLVTQLRGLSTAQSSIYSAQSNQGNEALRPYKSDNNISKPLDAP